MRTVFSNSELVHTFAQRTQSEGRTSTRTMFFNENKIYSYGHHYLLGEFIGDNTIIINNKGYSSSTGKHIGMLISATRQYRQLFNTNIDINLVKQRIEEASNKLKTAKKPELYVTPIIRDFEVLTEYLNEFEKENVLKSDDYKAIKEIYSALKEDEGKYIELAKERGKKELERAKKAFNESLTKFFNYEIDRIYDNKIKEDYLRISLDGTKVETTQSVKIDVEDARNLYRMIKAGIDIAGERISNYTVKSLNGHLTIGCHSINVKNMHEVGAKLITPNKQ
jgi:hypothetical protein